MDLKRASLNGIILLEAMAYHDERGYFLESFNYKDLTFMEAAFNFIQDNEAFSMKAGTLRGLHYQMDPRAQTKLVRVVTGAVYDVVVDLRSESSTFKKWEGFILSADNHRQLLIPKGFAHGYCTLVPNTTFLYKVDENYSPSHERGILWNDTELQITWPFTNPIVSNKDQNLPRLKDVSNLF